tara:strand:+ start:468 stop:869 length:402 start_codon:yes stop_codon:yes gene_type:complete
MKLKTKAWLVSQGLLLVVAFIIQVTFYRAIKVGPVLGMAKRPYVEIIKGEDLVIPESILSQNLPPEAYDARLPLSQAQIRKSNLAAYRRAAQQEEGLRTAFIGGVIVNVLYFFAYHLLFIYFTNSIKRYKREL